MFENLTRKPGDLGLIPSAPKAAPPPNPLEDHDVALYVDGQRISATYLNVAEIPAANEEDTVKRVGIYIETTVEAALNSTVNAFESQAWNGFKPMDHVGIRIADGMPQSGMMFIEHIIMPTRVGDEPRFKGKALTPIYNLVTSEQLAKAEDDFTMPVSWAVRQGAMGPQL